jgi:Holliday junction resolvase
VRRDARTDANQDEIVEALRGVGVSVFVTSMIGSGFPDIVAGYRGINYLIEIKDGSKPPSKRRLTPDEQKFHDLWRGVVIVVKGIDEALRAVGAIE